jgi:hypothetical protein
LVIRHLLACPCSQSRLSSKRHITEKYPFDFVWIGDPQSSHRSMSPPAPATDLTHGNQAVLRFRASADGSKIVYSMSTATRINDLFAVDRSGVCSR